MIQAWRYRPKPGTKSYHRQLVRVIVLSGDAFGEDSDGASPTGAGGSLVVRASSGVLATGDVLQLPDQRAYKVVAGRGLQPFFFMTEHDCERVRQQVFAVA